MRGTRSRCSTDHPDSSISQKILTRQIPTGDKASPKLARIARMATSNLPVVPFLWFILNTPASRACSPGPGLSAPAPGSAAGLRPAMGGASRNEGGKLFMFHRQCQSLALTQARENVRRKVIHVGCPKRPQGEIILETMALQGVQ
eukprot:scaffold174798_cov21-Tisochrysis_lutea.AAC.3